MEVRSDMHRAGRTHSGKGGKARQAKDAGNLRQAALDDLAAHRDFVQNNGGDVNDFDSSAAAINQRNEEKGVHDNPIPSSLWS